MAASVDNSLPYLSTVWDNKVKLLLSYAGEFAGEVADPWYTGDFEATYRDVLAGCQGILDSYPPIEENTRKDDNLNE